MSLTQIFTMALMLVTILVFFQQAALAASVKKWVQANEKNIHYGVSSDIFVNNSVRVDVVKVAAVWATRTDEANTSSNVLLGVIARAARQSPRLPRRPKGLLAMTHKNTVDRILALLRLAILGFLVMLMQNHFGLTETIGHMLLAA